MSKEIPIFFTVDNGYVPYLDIALYSLNENASKDYNYRIVVLQQGLTDTNIERLRMHTNDNFRVDIIEMKTGLDGITDRVENRLRCDYFTLTIYFRLFIADMFPEYDKGIYIDSDIIVPGDISQLYNTDIGDNLIGACPDFSVADIPQLQKYMKYAIGININEYINSGVLLMNLKSLRDNKFSSKFLYLLNEYHFDNVAPDQDYLNAMCNGHIYYLDNKWDAMPNKNNPPLSSPNLIHYNLFDKPWCYDNIQYEEYFWKYAKLSPFYNQVLEFKKAYSPEQMKSDSECLETILQKSFDIPDTDVTFRKVREKGEKIRVI